MNLADTPELKQDPGSKAAACLACQGTDAELFSTAVDRVLTSHGRLWHIERCRKCGFGWTSPPLPEDEIASFYPATYLGNTLRALEEYSSGLLVRTRSWRGELEKVQVVHSCLQSGKILDVGCGDGKFLWALDSRHWDRTGVELSAETVSLVRSRIPSIRLIAGDIFNDELAEAGFDLLTFWHVLEHLPHPALVLARAWRLLRPGGWLFVSFPRFDSLQARVFRKYWYPFGDVPRHLYHFSLGSLDMLLQAAGFQTRRHIFFSRRVNFHSLKHSLLNWSQDRFRSKVPYYLLKPLLFPTPALEQITGTYGILTTIAQKPNESPVQVLRHLKSPHD